jgi:AraC-like DNA-binding protein
MPNAIICTTDFFMTSQSTLPVPANQPLLRLLREKVLPWVERPEINFVVSAEHLSQSRLPAGVLQEERKMRGRRVVARGPRDYGNRSILLATWPEDGLIEMRDGIKLMCVMSGVADLQFGTHQLRCPEGSFIIVPPGVPHPDGTQPHLSGERPHDPNQACDLLWLLQRGRSIECWMCRSIGTHHLSPHNGEVALLFNGKAVELLQFLKEESVTDNPYSAQICRGLLLALLTLVAREIEETAHTRASRFRDGHHEPPQNNGEAWEPIEQSKRYVQANLKSRLTIAQVASAVHLSRTQFVSRFRAETGQSFNEYLTACRLKEAQFLLRESGWSIEHISRAVGLRAPTYFAEMFLRHTGHTPSRYRAKHTKSAKKSDQ